MPYAPRMKFTSAAVRKAKAEAAGKPKISIGDVWVTEGEAVPQHTSVPRVPVLEANTNPGTPVVRMVGIAKPAQHHCPACKKVMSHEGHWNRCLKAGHFRRCKMCGPLSIIARTMKCVRCEEKKEMEAKRATNVDSDPIDKTSDGGNQ